MKRVRFSGAALAATLFVCVVSVASASAAPPEFKGATLPDTFTSVSGEGHLVAGSNTITCTKDTNEGEVNGAKTVAKLVVKFTGCSITVIFKFECKSKGAAPGEIVTRPLEGALGYINKTAKTVGLKLQPAGGGEYTEGEIECASQKVRVTGAVIGVVSPTNTLSTKGTVDFTRSGTKQVPEEIEINGVVETGVKLSSTLNGGSPEEAAEETLDEITFAKAIEVTA